jgi:hypothetical protein
MVLGGGSGGGRNGKKIKQQQQPDHESSSSSLIKQEESWCINLPGLHNGNNTSVLGELCNPSPDPIMTNY